MPITNYYCVNGAIIGEHTVGQSRLDYVTDVLGSVIATVDQTLTVQGTARYKPSGAVLVSTGTQPAFGFTGSTGSRRTGLPYSDLYNQARHLGTSVGRWTTSDPVWPFEPAYTYVRANPTTFIDPTGFSPACDVPPGAGRPIPMAPASPCAMYPGGPCEYAKTTPVINGAGGGVVCCDGVKYDCSWQPSGLPPGLYTCAKRHEHSHEPDIQCPPTGFSRPPFTDPGRVNPGECAASVIEIQCLVEQRPIDCNKLSGSARTSCLTAYHNRICQMCRYMDAHHCPTSQYPGNCSSC